MIRAAPKRSVNTSRTTSDVRRHTAAGPQSLARGTKLHIPSDHVKVGLQYIRFADHDGSISISTSATGHTWQRQEFPALEQRQSHFDDAPLFVLESPLLVPEGILVIYFVRNPLAFGAALFDKDDPTKLLKRSAKAFWSTDDDLHPVRVEKLKNHVVLVFKTSDGEEIKTVLPLSHILGTLRISHIVRHRPPRLKKPDHNPIITPNPDHPWESQATFNTAALHLDGKVHFLYRAIGDTGVSVLGYASSVDGLHIDERLAEPAYVSTSDFDERRGRPIFRTPYGSGGGYGGVEDPRLILVDGRIYMTYVAFDGWRPPRVALTSIEIEDFLKHRWCWKPPVLISPPDVVDKNAVIFPERVRGKYVIFHRIFPNVLVDFVDSLDFQEGEYLKGEFVIPPREDSWDSRKLGAGAPPMKTKDGWLLIYHAVDDKDASKYKIGAMLLDLDDPRKVLHRTMSPILEPDMPYENDGYKSGVAYPCGAVILKDHLFVYYGGADTVTCVAWHPLDEFLEHLKKH